MNEYSIRCDDEILAGLINLSAETLDEAKAIFYMAMDAMNATQYMERHGSFVTNFKDAMMHYRKMVNAYGSLPLEGNENCLETIIQFELFMEHINRGLTDTLVEMLQNMWRLLEGLICIGVVYHYDVENGSYFDQLRDHLCKCTEHLFCVRNSKREITRLVVGGLNSRHLNDSRIDLFNNMLNFYADSMEHALNGEGDERLINMIKGYYEGTHTYRKVRCLFENVN